MFTTDCYKLSFWKGKSLLFEMFSFDMTHCSLPFDLAFINVEVRIGDVITRNIHTAKPGVLNIVFIREEV